MPWIQDRWQRMRFNRLDFEREYVVDQVLSEKPRSCVLLTHRRGGSQQTIMKLSDPAAANPLEVQCLRSLQHPGIAGYLGHGVTRDRRLWMETEYIDGVTLSAWLEDWTPSGEAAHDPSGSAASDLFLQLLSVVQYLHCCGWLHGDLTPQNILISTGKEQVVLVDFEHVRAIDGTNSKSMPRKHSLTFASPHEIAGGATTEACEQFALGKLGLLSFGGAEHQATEGIRAVLGRASSLRPEDRYPSLQAVAVDFQERRLANGRNALRR